MGVMKFVLTDELEQELRKQFRRKGDFSKIVELALRKHLSMKYAGESLEEPEDLEA